MEFSSKLLENAVNEMSQLPGIGKRTALRLVLHLLRQPEEHTLLLSNALSKVRAEINFCKSCHNISDKPLCEICDNPTIFATLAFSRDHAKSVLLMMIIILLYRRGEINNFLLVSYNAENAMDLIRPIKIQFETNQRLIHDFGILKGPSQWTNEKFITTDGVVFRSIGTGQNPRGARDEEDRPDFILFDDADDDELCRNPARLDKSWEWLMGALFGCFSIKGNKRFIGVGNIIAKDSIMVRASRKSDFHLQINILRNTTRDLSEEIHYHKNLLAKEEDENQIKLLKMALGYLDRKMIPSWHQRFTLLEVCYMIEKMGYRLSQREYFNNPLTEGKVFKKEWFQFGKMPNLRQLRFKLSYLDPGFKKTKSADTKSWILMGLHEGKYYILKAFCGVGSINEMIMWGYEIQDYLNRKNAAAPMWMEEVFLQDLLYKDFE